MHPFIAERAQPSACQLQPEILGRQFRKVYLVSLDICTGRIGGEPVVKPSQSKTTALRICMIDSHAKVGPSGARGRIVSFNNKICDAADVFIRALGVILLNNSAIWTSPGNVLELRKGDSLNELEQVQ